MPSYLRVSCPRFKSAFLLAALAVFAGCTQEKNVFAPPPPPKVVVSTPKVEDVTLYASFPGTLEAAEKAEVRARVNGLLQAIHFEEGAWVEKDALLYSVEPDVFEASAKAASARLEQSKAQAQLAETKLDVSRQLLESQAIAEVEFLQREAESKVADSDILLAEANLQSAQIDLAYTEIKAPISGKASRHLVDIGNVVGPGGVGVLNTIVLDDPIYAYFTVSERVYLGFLERLEGGNRRTRTEAPFPAQVELANGKLYPIEGVVDFAENEIDRDTGTITIRARFDNPNGNLIPGLFARVRIPHSMDQAVLVPDVAIQRDIKGPHVYTVGDDNTASLVYLEIGDTVEGDRIVLNGLAGTERVVVQGLQRIRHGVTVSVEQESAE